MGDQADYTPPKVWKWKSNSEDMWADINRPTAGARFEKELPVGKNPIQVYSLGTANSIKVAVMLEELLALGHDGAKYDKHSIDIFKGEQFGSGFVKINPNSKIPAMVDHSTPTPTRIFESGAILLYLAKKFDAFLPTDLSAQAECLSWLFWQVGTAPYLGGGFGYFYKFAPEKTEYAIDRFTMEVKRQLDLLDQHLAENTHMCGDEYTIADIAIWPWLYALFVDNGYGASEFLDVQSYKHVNRWIEHINEREAAKRGYGQRSTPYDQKK